MYVAEGFTNRKGTYVPIRETVRGFREILEGRYDDVPEQAFFMQGSIEDVVAEIGAHEGALDGGWRLDRQEMMGHGPRARL